MKKINNQNCIKVFIRMSFITLSIFGYLFSFAQYYSASAKKTLNLGKKVERIDWHWHSPQENNTYSDNTLELNVDLFTLESIDIKGIEILINGKASGSRARELPLNWNKMDGSERKKMNISRSFRAEDGQNTLTLIITEKNGNKIEKNVSFTKTIVKAGVVSALWVSPDPFKLDGKPLRQAVPEMPFSIQLNTTMDLNKENLKLVLNGQEQSFPINVKIQKSGSSSMISASVTFSDTININTFFIKYVSGNESWQSDKLLVKYYKGTRPGLYILSMAPNAGLKYSVKDGRDIAQLFSAQGGENGNKLFHTVTIDTVLDQQANRGEMAGRIEELQEKYAKGLINSDDLLILFLSSHGFINTATGDFRIQANDYNPSRINNTSISYKTEVLDQLAAIPCKKLIFIDACHSGARANIAEINTEIEKLNKSKGITSISSSRKAEESFEDDKWQNGAFTKAIIEALKEGKADSNGNKIITINELYNYISKNVPAMVMEVKKAQQNPVMNTNELGNIGIYVIQP